MKKEFLDKESEAKRDKKFVRVYAIVLLTVLIGGLFILAFLSNDLDLITMTMLLYALVLLMFIFIWVFKLQYHLVPALLKDDESMELDEIP